MSVLRGLLLAGAFAPTLFARDIPANVRNFYERVQSGTCSDSLADGFYNTEGSAKDWSYCQQEVAGQAIFIKGRGQFANMDVDCDGHQSTGDGRCASSTDTQSQTTFQDIAQSYGIKDLDANVHPYVVFGNQGNYSPTFDPQEYGIQPLSVMAVVCGDKLIYGVWGDTNGDDGPPLVGEASLSLATACFGDSVNGNSGHDENDVLYIAFSGPDAVPGKDGADWAATSYDDFESSIETLGDSLINRIPC